MGVQAKKVKKHGEISFKSTLKQHVEGEVYISMDVLQTGAFFLLLEPSPLYPTVAFFSYFSI